MNQPLASVFTNKNASFFYGYFYWFSKACGGV